MTVLARRNRLLVAVLVAASMTAAILGVAVLTARSAQAAGTVYLEPRDAVGENPFLPLNFPPAQPADPAVAVPDAAGTGDQGTCDPATLSAYLVGHPAAATAWVAALDADPGLQWTGGDSISVEQIPAYIAELTPAVLGGDMQVTNHRFVDGQLAAVQSVLQEGTAVLVDSAGTPRVRCACGNPLTPAAEWDDESGDTEYAGAAWDGFTYDEDADDQADDQAHDQADDQADTDAHEDEDVTDDHPVVDCKRGEYREGDHCVQRCPRGTFRDDDGRCRAPLGECDPKKHDWCKPHPGCRQHEPAGHEAAPAAEKRRNPCPPPPCDDGEPTVSRTTDGGGCAPPPCTKPDGTGTAATEQTRLCTPPACPEPTSERTVTRTSTGACEQTTDPKITEGGADAKEAPAVDPNAPVAGSTPDTSIPNGTSSRSLVGPQGGPAPDAAPVPDPATTAPTTTPPVTTTTTAPTTTVPPPTTPAVVEAPPVANAVPAPAPVQVAPAAPAPAKKVAPAKPAVRCPNGKVMPATGCLIPDTGVPAGWVLRAATNTMVPAAA